MVDQEPKLALLARLHGAVPLTFKIIKRSFEKRDYVLLMMAFSNLKTFVSKNDNNLLTLQKTNIVSLIDSIIRSNGQQNVIRLDLLLDILALVSKSSTQI
jgi:hypothetical protein